MTSISTPLYKTDPNDFVIEFYKHNDETLSLSTAKRYFVQLVGVNILKGYYFFRNAVISDDQLIGSDVISNNNIVCNKLVCNESVINEMKVNKLICNEIVTNKSSVLPNSIYGYFYVNNMSIPIIISDTISQSLFNDNITTINVLLLPKVKLLFYNSQTTKKQIYQNKETRNKMFNNIDVSKYTGYYIYFDNVLK